MKQLFVLISFLVFSSVFVYSQEYNVPKKSISIDIVEVVPGHEGITIYFNVPSGKVTVAVTDDQGKSVYRDVLDTDTQNSLLIPAAGWTGACTVRITGRDGITTELTCYKK